MTDALPARPHKRGIAIDVRLSPRAGRDEITGVADGSNGPVLKVRVRAIPDRGKANAALIVLLAKWMGVAKSDLDLSAGAKSRSKTVRVAGETDELFEQLETALAGLS